MKFATEKEMVDKFIGINVSTLTESQIDVHITSEMYEAIRLNGKPDFVFDCLIDGGHIVISFELKRNNWKRALEQAYRYRAFSELSVVVIDESCSAAAVKNIDRFIRAGVGLVGFDTDRHVTIHFMPPATTPYSDTFKQMALEKICRLPHAGLKTSSEDSCLIDSGSMGPNFAYLGCAESAV